MAYNFFDTGGAKPSNVLSPDLISQAMQAYGESSRRPSALEADIARNRQATQESQLAEREARMMQQYYPSEQQYGQQEQQYSAGQYDQQPMQQPMEYGQQPMQYGQQPMQQPMQREQQYRQQPMQQPSERPPLGVAMKMSRSQGFEPKLIEKDGQSYYTTTLGEYPVGPSAPTAFQKGLNELSLKAISEIDSKYPAVVDNLSEVQSMVEMSRAPEFDKAFSSAPGSYSRSVSNWYTQNFGDAPVADVRTQFINKADKLVMGMMGDIKGSLTNRELSFLQRQKPNPNDSPREIRSKLDNIMTSYSLAEKRLSAKRGLIEQGLSPVEASKVATSMVSRDDVSRESKEAVYGKDEESPDVGPMISQYLQEQGAQQYPPQDSGQSLPVSPEDTGNSGPASMMDMLRKAGSAASYATHDIPQMGVETIGNLGSGLMRGGLQGAENIAVSTANAPIDAINYLAGISHPRIQRTNWADLNPESTAQRYGQNIGQFATEAGIPAALGVGAVGRAKDFANARNIGPALSAAMQTAAGAGAGGLEGALLNEENRGMGAAIGGSLGAIGGLLAGGMDYANRVGKSRVANNIANEAVAAQKLYGDKITDVIDTAKSMGADKGLTSVKIPELISKEFSNEMYAVKSFNKNKTIESGQKALSNVGDIIRKLEVSGVKPGSLAADKLDKAIKLQASLRANIGNALEKANVPGGADALFDALSQYKENVIPLTKNPAVSAYLKSGRSAADAKRMVESVLKDSNAMEALAKSHPELANIKNLRTGARIGGAVGGMGLAGKTGYELLTGE